MLPASVIVVIVVFSLVFVGVLAYFLTLSSRIKHLREKLDEKEPGSENTQK